MSSIADNLVADNLARVQERIARAAEGAGRAAEDITLVAVTKRQSAATIEEALACGLTDLGENYVQEAQDKQNLLPGEWAKQAHWHLIGHLQSNKAKAAVQIFDLIQSVDTVSLARALGRHAGTLGKTQQILLQVHLGDEASKSGAGPAEALNLAGEIGTVADVELCGLMGIAPGSGNPQPHFAQLHGLFEQLPAAQRHILSMGMTSDLEAAIHSGSTMLRIGTALFGPRTT